MVISKKYPTFVEVLYLFTIKLFVMKLLQFISLCVGGLCLLLLLGAEPNSTESSMYEYEHFCDKGHFGWYLLWALGISFVTFLITTIIQLVKK